MNTNIFEEIKNKRTQVKNFAQAALERNWISTEEYNTLIDKIDNDTLTIGVIGQMKCGKSTFLNSFLFGEEILPSATTPMTAALSVITYGSEKSIEVEFYNSNEWEEMKMQAERSIEDAGGDKPKESKIKAAKELVEKSHKIGAELPSILGTTKKDKFENLIEYVGADGKYVSITKSVTIYYPEEWLKGVRVVDTPGFNDPVVSREERTQEFLKKADVVLMLLYAGRAFDATDRDIVFEKVRSVGIGKILIGINKYDIQYGQGETIEEITNNVKEEIAKACREYGDTTIKELLLNLEPIPFSANMALMAKQPLEKIKSNENYKFHWDKTCDNFEISTQKEMLEKSLVKNLEDAIKNVIEHSKHEILLKKPINSILQSGENKRSKINSELAKNTELKNTLSLSDEGLDERVSKINRANRRIERLLDNATNEIKDEFSNAYKKVTREVEDDIDKVGKKLHSIIDEHSVFGKREPLERKLDGTLDDLWKFNIIRKLDDTEDNIKDRIKAIGDDISNEIENNLKKYLDDYDEILHQFNNALRNTEYSDDSNNENEEATNNSSDDFSWGDAIAGFIKGALLIPFIYNLANWKDDYHKWTNNIISDIKETSFPLIKEELAKRLDFYLSRLNTIAAEKILPNLIEQIEALRGKAEEREAKIKYCEEHITSFKNELSQVSQQIDEMKSLAKHL